MSEKDHYHILNVSPSASADEIKKAFRKLALAYHPDKHNNDPVATKKFIALKESYGVLSDRKKRAAYNYERYTQNPQRAARTVVHSADHILFLSNKLHKEIFSKDPFRIDRDLLFFQLADLLSDENKWILQEYSDQLIIRKIVEQILACTRLLPLPDAKGIIQHLYNLSQADESIKLLLKETLQEIKQQYLWNRYKPVVALVITLLVCICIYLVRGNTN